MPRSQCEKDNVQLVQELAEVDGPFESPINLNFRDLIKLELPSLTWNKPDAVPKKMKITNTGHTVIVSGKWKCERPYLTGGPLNGKYVFSQIHFHWGPDNYKGSEHQVSGESFPLEMHVAHFKTEYVTQESALREKDGMVVLVYLFKLQEEPNESLKKLIGCLPAVSQANTSKPLECRSILALCNPFTDDYFMYWGSVVTSSCAHILLWIVCREPFGISKDQMEEFRKICDASHHPIKRNSREPQPLHKRNVFHVNASRHLDEPMLPIKKIHGCFCLPVTENGDGRKGNKPEGDGVCGCYPDSGPQEELEGRQNTGCRQEMVSPRGNGVFMQQTVYYQHSTVHSVPPFQRKIDDAVERNRDDSEEKYSLVQEVSQSCCFLPIEEGRDARERRHSREKAKDRRRRPIDSVTTLANLLETLETLKTETYKKLKEIESINYEIKGMKSSCENLEERNWLRQAEKIMSRQKRFTVRSSQCCFSELKKLARECNFDKLLDDNVKSEEEDGKLLRNGPTDSAVVCSKASGNGVDFPRGEKTDIAPFGFCNAERFSRKAQKLIQSFFEDIKESEETQLNVEKNLLLKKFEKLSKRRSELSNASSLNVPLGQVCITKNMMNMGPIREQFFTEIPNDEKAITPTETKLVPSTKKKKRSFFQISLSGFEGRKDSSSKKGQKRSLFTKTALAWLNNRLNTIHDTRPVIPLRITDIELRSGNITAKKKSKHSMKSASIRKIPSDDHVRTEVSSYLSESFISEFSDKQSKFSRQSRKQTRSLISTSETRRKGELSIMKLVQDFEGNNLFVHLSNSANISSVTSTESERKDTKFIKKRSRRDIWENGSSTMSGLRKEVSNKVDLQCIRSLTGNIIERRINTSSDSCIMIKESKIVMVTSRKPSIEMIKPRDASADAIREVLVNSPKRKKPKLEWENKERESGDAGLFISPETNKIEYFENECPLDLNNNELDTVNSCGITNSKKSSFEKLTNVSLTSPRPKTETENETEKESVVSSPRQLLKDTSVEAKLTLVGLPEDATAKNIEKSTVKDQSDIDASEESAFPRRSSDTLSEHSKDCSFEIERTVVLSDQRGAFWKPDLRYGMETRLENPETQKKETVTQKEQTNVPRTLNKTDIELAQERISHSNKNPPGNVHNEPESSSLFTVHELENSREVSQNELSESNEYDDIHTDSNGTLNYSQEKERSRDTTPSIISSEDDKIREASVATVSSVMRISSQQKPYSAESLNSCEVKRKKKRQTIKKKSKPLPKNNNAIMKKLSQIDGSNMDFTNLTEEEQLKIISANVARFVKQKLLEHKQFFDFQDPLIFNHEQWGNSEQKDLTVASEAALPEAEVKEKEEKVAKERGEPVPVPCLEPVMENKAEEESQAFEGPPSSPNAEKDDKIESRQTLDFIKLNKIMAGKYKRRCGPDWGKKQIKKDSVIRRELARATTAKPGATNTESETPKANELKAEAPPKIEIKLEAKPEVKPEAKPEVKLEAKSETKSETKPETKAETKSETKPETPKQIPSGRGMRAPSVDSARRGTSLQRGQKSDIPVPQYKVRANPRAASVAPTKIAVPKTNPPLALQRPRQPKQSWIPTYTLTSYLSAPNDIIKYQQKELDKYLNKDFTDFFLESSKSRYKYKKNLDSLSKKNLDYLIMLQKKINREISANIENSMNYVKTLLSQDYNGTAIIEKAPVRSSLDVFEPGNGIVLIEMNDQIDCSSSGSEFSEESGFYCIYQGRKRKERSRKREIFVKSNESGDSGLVDSRMFEELQDDTDSSCIRSLSIIDNPKKRDELECMGEISDVLNKYIYHLGEGDESDYFSNESRAWSEKKPLKKRMECVVDMPKDMKRRLLDRLEDEMKNSITDTCSCVDEESSESWEKKTEDEIESVEMISKISDMVMQYLDEYDRKHNSEDGTR